MLENRSFDNVLGYLYENGVPAGKKFEGLQTGNYSCPVPSRAADYKTGKVIKPHQATDLHQPYPDPGEFYAHVNTQLYNYIDNDNINIDGFKMKSPYNQPAPLPATPTMNGFVNDYINTLQTLEKNGEKVFPQPKEEQYGAIMQCYKPEQVPALTTLAKEFAVFDHWHCSVPSQTWCNRAFWHSATSGGFVVNPVGEGGGLLIDEEGLYDWKKEVSDKSNLFMRMNHKGLRPTVYSDGIVSLSKLLYLKLFPDFNSGSIGDFINHAQNGKLPEYSFVEPNFMAVEHDDMHPSSIKKGPTHAGTVELGDRLIARIYEAIFKSQVHRDNTLLIITTDEHGGCFDHVPSPSAVSTSEFIYDPKTLKHDDSFKFDRLGVRVPMVMVSAYIQKNTIMNETYDHTSFIRTMSKKWGLSSLTARDDSAKSFEGVFSETKRDEFPDLSHLASANLNTGSHDAGTQPLNGLQRSILIAADYLASQNKKENIVPESLEKIHEIDNVKDALSHLENLKPYLS